MTASKDAVVEMHAAIGFAITAWSEVESALARTLAACLGPGDANVPGVMMLYEAGVAFAAFYAVDQFRSKLSLVHAVVTARVPAAAEDGSAWTRLYKKAGDLSLKRNRLAHWDVTMMDTGAASAPMLMPPHHSPRYAEFAFGDKVPMTIHEVRQLGKAFSSLGRKIDAYTVEIVQTPEVRDHWASMLQAQAHNTENYHITRQSGRGIDYPIDEPG
jgi:hypothetical protein